jgi:carotenoid cleavage dioxygenase-like enzyme
VPPRLWPQRLLRFAPVEADGHPFLEGNFAPVSREHNIGGPLPVTGTLPPELDGMLVRNGPNPATIGHPAQYRWCTGDGMVHAVTLHRGRATAYRNRWVRTRVLASEADVEAPRGPLEVTDSPANANVVAHGGRLLALAEAGLPYRLTPKLATKEVYDFGGEIASPVSPRPRVDPAHGGMTLVGYDCFGPPYLWYYETDASGVVVHTTEVPTPRATMHHDFGLTERHVVFLDLPVVYELDRVRTGIGPPFRWQPEVGGRVGLLERGAPGEATQWFDVDPCAVFHVMNAYDDGDVVKMEVCRHGAAFVGAAAPDGAHDQATGSPRLERWEIDPAADRVARAVLHDRPVEWPAVAPTRVGRRHRWGYCAEPPESWREDRSAGLVRFDLARGQVETFDPGPGRAAGEPVVVTAPGARDEEQGWVLSMVYDTSRGTTDLVVLDTSRFTGPPQATVHLPHRVPFGLHGSWVPAGTV